MAIATARNVDDKDYAHLSEGAESLAVRSRINSGSDRRVCPQARSGQVRRQNAGDSREQSKGLLGPWPDSVALIRAIRDKE